MKSLLAERHKTHGSFADVASVAQGIKNVLRSSPKFDFLSSDQAEVIDGIAVKLARAVCGDPDFLDHWEDIGGYAALAVQDIHDRIKRDGSP